jgi:hypothetical protein
LHCSETAETIPPQNTWQDAWRLSYLKRGHTGIGV